MFEHMSVKISNGLEVFFTTISHTVMAHIEVGEFVLLQPAIKRKCFATCFTHKVKFPVYIRVLIQSCLCSKTFATITTKLDVVFRTMVFVQGFDTFAGGITDLYHLADRKMVFEMHLEVNGFLGSHFLV